MPPINQTSDSCPYCFKSFLNKTNNALRKHKSRCIKRPTYQPVVCFKCKMKFTLEQSLRLHQEKCVKKTKDYVYVDCHQEFDGPHDLRTHRSSKCVMRSVLSFNCKFDCGQSSIYKSNIIQHESNCKLNLDRKDHICQHCQIKCSSSRLLNYHLKYYCVSIIDQKEYLCSSCEASFRDPYVRNMHFIYDCKSNEKRIIKYVCPICCQQKIRHKFNHHVTSCESNTINGVLVPIEFTLEDVLNDLDNQADLNKKNYVYLISGDTFLEKDKLSDYLGTGSFYRVISHFISSRLIDSRSLFTGTRSKKLNWLINKSINEFKISRILFTYHRQALFVEGNLILRHYDRCTNINKELSNSQIIKISKEEKTSLLDRIYLMLSQQIETGGSFSITSEFIDELIERLFNIHLCFASCTDLESYVSKTVSSNVTVIDPIFQKHFNFSLIK